MNASFLEKNQAHQQSFGHLMEGIKHPYMDVPSLNEMEENKMGILLSNSIAEFCHAKGFKSYEHIKEAQTASTDASTFYKIALPMIRKVFPAMIAREFVSIQPMSQPVWKLFYLDVVRDDATSVADDIHTNRSYGANVEYNPSSATAIKELSMSITDSSVSATTIKLKEKHTIEAEQDIMAYHGINVASFMSDQLAAEVVREWDRLIIQDMLDSATGGAATFDQTVPTGITYTDRKVWMEGIYEALLDVDNQIFKKRYRKSNFIITTPDIATFIAKMAGFRMTETDVNQQSIQTGGRYFMGTLDTRWRVYVDPFLPAGKALLGFNNPGNWMETSYVFSPYVMSYFTDTWTDPNTQQRCRSILSRAAKKAVVPNLLGVLTVSGS
jgi:hypothetical protein